jgi:aspartate/methionine/tyrosine aminotransferase
MVNIIFGNCIIMSKISSMRISNRKTIKGDVIKQDTMYNFSPCANTNTVIDDTIPFYKINSNTIIQATIGDPYMISETLAPNPNCFNADKPNTPSGLSYMSDNTTQRDILLIRELYRTVYGITIPSTAIILTGCGSTLLAGAYIYAVQRKLGKNIIVSSTRQTTYGGYKAICNSVLKNTQWNDRFNNSDIYALVSPNNPDGYIISENDFTSFNQNPNAYVLADCIYDAKHITNQPILNRWVWNYLSDPSYGMQNRTAIISSFSKLGIAGFRYGYIILNDSVIAQYMNDYIYNTVLMAPTAGAQAAYNNYHLFWKNPKWHYDIYSKLQSRYQQFVTAAGNHGVTVLNNTPLLPFIYTNKSASWWLTNFNIATKPGSVFNDTDDNSRLNLMLYDHQWDALIKRLSS